VLAKALQSISKNGSYDLILKGHRELEKEETRRVSHTFPVKTGFVITFHNEDDKCEFQWEESNKLVHMHPSILWWMASNWWKEVVSHGHGRIVHQAIDDTIYHNEFFVRNQMLHKSFPDCGTLQGKMFSTSKLVASLHQALEPVHLLATLR
jgi:hypothetical protein